MADWIREGSPEHYTKTAKECAEEAVAASTAASGFAASAVEASDKAVETLGNAEALLKVIKSYAASADTAASWAAESAENASSGAEAAYYFAEMASEEAFALSESVERLDILEEGKLDTDATLLSEAGRSLIAGLGFPGGTYVDLTDASTEAALTAPVNGFFVYRRAAAAPGQTLELVCEASRLRSSAVSQGSEELAVWLPAKGGDTVRAAGTATGGIVSFGFVHAEGEA